MSRLCDNETVFSVSRRNRREVAVQHSSGSQFDNACSGFYDSHVTTSGSCFLPFCKTQTLSDLMNPPAFRSIQQSQVWSSLPRGETRCSSIQRRMLCVTATGSSHIASPFGQQCQTRSSSVKASGLCSATRLSCLRLLYGAFCKGSTSCLLAKTVRTNSRHLLQRFMLH